MNNTEKILNYISLIDPINQQKCLSLFEEHRARFEKSPGSLTKHQAWEGGYIEHLVESMDFAVVLHLMMDRKRKLPFSAADAILILFLHDLEKPFKYVVPKTGFHSDKEKEEFIYRLIAKYDIVLNDEQKNALKYIHGEGSDYSPTERIQLPLAAFCHMCDVASARIWFDKQ